MSPARRVLALLAGLASPAAAETCPRVDYHAEMPARRILGTIAPDAPRCFLIEVRRGAPVSLELDQGAEDGVEIAAPAHGLHGTRLDFRAGPGDTRLEIVLRKPAATPVVFRVRLGPAEIRRQVTFRDTGIFVPTERVEPRPFRETELDRELGDW